MKEFIGYKNGINLGGWLSQCGYEEEHMESFIAEADIERIASWGCDHVRLPFDYNVILDDSRAVRADAFKYLDRCVGWCEKHGLNIILDLHKTCGFSFDKGERENGFFEDKSFQDIFVGMWREIAKHYAGKPENVAFELLNEITDKEYAMVWNAIAARTVRGIREFAPKNPILIGGIYQNSVFGLTLLDKPCDENIVFNFHYYNPLVFTHQKAYWIDAMSSGCEVSYPDKTDIYYHETLNNVGSDLAQTYAYYNSDMVDASFIDWEIKTAAAVSEKMGVPVYCGEYGVIDRAPGEDMLRWYKDMTAVFDKYDIGRAAWTYRAKDFGLTDDVRKEVLPDIVKFFRAR